MCPLDTPWLCSACKPAVSGNSFDSFCTELAPPAHCRFWSGLFFTARQTGDVNQIKQFVQFLASCVLEIRISARLHLEQNCHLRPMATNYFPLIWSLSLFLIHERHHKIFKPNGEFGILCQTWTLLTGSSGRWKAMGSLLSCSYSFPILEPLLPFLLAGPPVPSPTLCAQSSISRGGP